MEIKVIYFLSFSFLHMFSNFYVPNEIYREMCSERDEKVSGPTKILIFQCFFYAYKILKIGAEEKK